MRGHLAAALAILLAVPASAQKAPPPTPVPPYGSPSPFPSVLHTPEPRDRPPKIDAAAVALADLDSGRILFSRRGKQRRPVASLTKIMTAHLVLSEARPFESVVASARAAGSGGAELGLRTGERAEVRDLLYALMLQSANDAAIALAEHIAGSERRFVRRMNAEARGLGARKTRFASPNGLDDRGRSTAEDLAAITAAAFRQEAFAEIVSTRRYTVPSEQGPRRRVQSRNALLWLYPGALGVKTGFTSAAGFCLVAAAERDDLRLIAVVLGSPDEAFSDAAALLDHGFHAFERRRLVGSGEEAGEIQVEGRTVAVAATEEIHAVVRRDAEVERIIEAASGLRLPVGEGDVVGRMIIRADDAELADLPLAALRPVAAEPVSTSTWWSRLARLALEIVLRLAVRPAI